MTLSQIKAQVMFQTGNDLDDLGDFEPHIEDYVNEGYDRLTMAFYKKHVGGAAGMTAPLASEDDAPGIPEWAHRALADYATWMIYRNGNQIKQSRGFQYRQAFDAVLSDAMQRYGEATQFINIYP